MTIVLARQYARRSFADNFSVVVFHRTHADWHTSLRMSRTCSLSADISVCVAVLLRTSRRSTISRFDPLLAPKQV